MTSGVPKIAYVTVLPTPYRQPLLERLAGLPLLLTHVVGAGLDLVEEGGNGYRVSVGNVNALAERWRAVLTTGDRARMASRSREMAFAWGSDTAVEQFRQCVFTIVGPDA